VVGANPPGFAAAAGLTPGEGANELTAQGFHLRAGQGQIQLSEPR
jgi:hypothetical protein